MSEQRRHLWLFSPTAREDDPAWQGRRIWSELEIVAETAGEAILFAARFDAEYSGLTRSDSQDKQQLRSGFEDARLYRVDRLEAEPPEGVATGHVVGARLLHAEQPAVVDPGT